MWLPVCVSDKKAPDFLSIQHEKSTPFAAEDLQVVPDIAVIQKQELMIWYCQWLDGRQCSPVYTEVQIALLLHAFFSFFYTWFWYYTIHTHTLTHTLTLTHTHSQWSLTSPAVRILMPASTQMKGDASDARPVLHCAPSLCEHTPKVILGISAILC